MVVAGVGAVVAAGLGAVVAVLAPVVGVDPESSSPQAVASMTRAVRRINARGIFSRVLSLLLPSGLFLPFVMGLPSSRSTSKCVARVEAPG